MDLKTELENNTSLTPAPSVSGSTQRSPEQPAPVRCRHSRLPGVNFPGGIKIFSC